MATPAAPTVPVSAVVAPATLPVPRQVVTHDYFPFDHRLLLLIAGKINASPTLFPIAITLSSRQWFFPGRCIYLFIHFSCTHLVVGGRLSC